MTEHQFCFRESRKFRHYTQEQVVNRLTSMDDAMLPQTEASLSLIETGKQPYSQRILEALADIYNVEPHQLIGHDSNKDGELIDLLAILNEKQKAQAVAVIQAQGSA